MDMLPTFVAAAGNKNVKKQLLKGYTSKSLERDYRIHLDGYDITKTLMNPEKVESPRNEIFYFTDDGDLSALRYGDWKIVFLEQRTEGTLAVWANPFTPLRVPLIFNLRRDPYERAQLASNTYYDWLIDRVYLLVPAQAYVGKFLETFKEYPPRQEAASFSLDKVMAKLSESASLSKIISIRVKVFLTLFLYLRIRRYLFIVFSIIVFSCSNNKSSTTDTEKDVLPSWSETDVKSNIKTFVKKVTDSSSNNFIPVTKE